MTAAAPKILSAAAADPRRWYLVATNSKQEKTAAFHLRRLFQTWAEAGRPGGEVYVPLRVAKIVGPTKHVGSVPLFPRYAFFRVDPGAAEWWAIRSAIGVKALVSGGNGTPAALPLGFVETLRRHEKDGLVSLRQLESENAPDVSVGDPVAVRIGEELYQAVVEAKLDVNRVRLLLSIAGGQGPKRVTVRRAQLQSLDLGVKADPKEAC